MRYDTTHADEDLPSAQHWQKIEFQAIRSQEGKLDLQKARSLYMNETQMNRQ